MRWRDFSSFCQVRGTFCQVLFFLPSSWLVCQVWYKLYRVSAKFLAFLPSLLAPSWQKIANSNELAENCQLGATQYKIHECHRERVQQFRVGNFLPTRSSWQSTANLAEKPKTWQKRNEKAETLEAPCTERYQGIYPASSTS